MGRGARAGQLEKACQKPVLSAASNGPHVNGAVEVFEFAAGQFREQCHRWPLVG